MDTKGTISETYWPIHLSFLCRKNLQKKTANKFRTTRENMSMMMNEGVDIHCKAVMNQVFLLVGLLVELGTCIEKSKGSIEAYNSIR